MLVTSAVVKEPKLTQLMLSEVKSPSDVGLAIYEKVQELTGGKSRRSARFLSAITCLELEGRNLPASTWCTLVLFSLSDLAIHAPGAVIAIRDWAVHYNSIAIEYGEATAQEMASALVWAGCSRRNIELGAFAASPCGVGGEAPQHRRWPKGTVPSPSPGQRGQVSNAGNTNGLMPRRMSRITEDSTTFDMANQVPASA